MDKGLHWKYLFLKTKILEYIKDKTIEHSLFRQWRINQSENAFILLDTRYTDA